MLVLNVIGRKVLAIEPEAVFPGASSVEQFADQAGEAIVAVVQEKPLSVELVIEVEVESVARDDAGEAKAVGRVGGVEPIASGSAGGLVCDEECTHQLWLPEPVASGN